MFSGVEMLKLGADKGEGYVWSRGWGSWGKPLGLGQRRWGGLGEAQVHPQEPRQHNGTAGAAEVVMETGGKSGLGLPSYQLPPLFPPQQPTRRGHEQRPVPSSAPQLPCLIFFFFALFHFCSYIAFLR